MREGGPKQRAGCGAPTPPRFSAQSVRSGEKEVRCEQKTIPSTKADYPLIKEKDAVSAGVEMWQGRHLVASRAEKASLAVTDPSYRSVPSGSAVSPARVGMLILKHFRTLPSLVTNSYLSTNWLFHHRCSFAQHTSVPP